MYVDKDLRLSDSQDLSQTAGSYYSTNAINLSGVVGDIGSGTPLYVVICIDAAFTSAGSATVKFEVIDEEDATLDGSSGVILSTKAFAYDDTQIGVGKILVIPLPAGIITQQYLGLKYTIGAATTTAGTVSAFVALQSPLNP